MARIIADYLKKSTPVVFGQVNRFDFFAIFWYFIANAFDSCGGQMIIGSGKQWLKQLRTDVQTVVLELCESKLVLGDPRLADVIGRLPLLHVKSTSDLFLACAELAQNKYLVVAVNNKNGGQPAAYTVFDAELLAALARKQLANPVLPVAVPVSSPVLAPPPVPVSAPSGGSVKVLPVHMEISEEAGKSSVTVSVTVIDEQWVGFLCKHSGKQFWNVALLVWLCTKGCSFWTVDLRLVLTGKKSLTGIALSKSSVSGYVSFLKRNEQVVAKRRSTSSSGGADIEWVAEVVPAVHDLLSRLLEEFCAFQEADRLVKKCLTKKKKRRKKKK